MKNYNKFGFTLAEVLITLGIIGVVATMMIPTLIQKCTNRVVETRLKTFYVKINEAIKLSEVDNGEKEAWTADNTEDFFNKYLKNYLKYMTVEKYKKNDKDNDWLLIKLIDGSGFLVDIYAAYDDDGNQTLKTNGGHFIFCPSAKNCETGKDYREWGKSQFVFGYWPAGEIAPKYHANRGVEPYLNAWDGKKESLYTQSGFGCNEKANGFYCTAIIKQNPATISLQSSFINKFCC